MPTYETGDGLQISEMRIDLRQMHDLLTAEAQQIDQQISTLDEADHPADFVAGLRDDARKLRSAAYALNQAHNLLTDFC